MTPLLSLPLIIVFAILLRLGIGVLNHARIRSYVAGQGGEVLHIKWHPFGAGWFGEKDSVIYEVRYRDREGNVRLANCKTGLFSGVYFTNDNIIHKKRQPTGTGEKETRHTSPSGNADLQKLLSELGRLRDENLSLRREIEKLRDSGSPDPGTF